MTTVLDAPRVVVYGEYPPFTTPLAAATLATVRNLLADGREIAVVSPRPSAAHHHADVGTVQGAVKLVRIVAGADLIAWLDRQVLGGPGPTARGPAHTALGLAVRRARSATIHLPPLPGVPSPLLVRAVLAPASRITVATKGDADTLLAAGLDTARVSVSDEAWWLGAAVFDAAPAENGPHPTRTEAWPSPALASRDDMQAEVRRRAAAHRDHESSTPVAAAWPLHMLSPLAPAPTESAKPLFRWVKRAVHRLVAWEVVPIVEQVNHLQRATMESFERQAEARSDAQDTVDRRS